MIGRKRDILSVRQSPHHPTFSPSASFLFKRVVSSVENPGRQAEAASDHHSTNQVRAQNVDGTSPSFFLTLALQNKSVISTQPPSPFYPLLTGAPPPSNHLLLTASFGRILPAGLLSLFRPTHTLNVHPSALPAYRGPAPIQRAILNGERDTAVCVIEMKRRGGIDAGDILGRIPIVRALQSFPYSSDQTYSKRACSPSRPALHTALFAIPSLRRAESSSFPFSALCFMAPKNVSLKARSRPRRPTRPSLPQPIRNPTLRKKQPKT